MSERLRLVLLLIAMTLPAIGLNRWMLMERPERLTFDPAAIPRHLDSWATVIDRRLDPTTLSIIEPDEHVMRLYRSESEAPVWLYVGFYTGRVGLKNAHDPEVCYPAQGWDILETWGVDIDLDDGEQLAAHFMRARKDSRDELIIYWFQPAQRWPTAPAWEELIRIWDAMRGSPQYAFVRVSVTVESGKGGEASLHSFVSHVAPYVRKGLDTADLGGARTRVGAPRAAASSSLGRQ